ncbi:hypothetical protein [Ensifer adhaerens]|uniref:hypothetical protein n=1 Tax=Ensifer adhaerens TaxID=106592 RepID=UPI000DC2CDCD|nr:hypothetical protein [Ensifer adhaerens]RAS18286.1 hypothetical protein DEU52_101529 [Ensifer adhaerens]
MSAATLNANPVAPFRYFHAAYFLGDFFFDGHQRLIVAPTLNEARQAAHVSGPMDDMQVHIEEVHEAEFEELCALYQREDCDRQWIVVVGLRERPLV